MAYTEQNFPTKKALKEAVAAGTEVFVFQPNNMFGKDYSTFTGEVSLEGPHYPKPHSWYATATMVNGIVTKVK